MTIPYYIEIMTCSIFHCHARLLQCHVSCKLNVDKDLWYCIHSDWKSLLYAYKYVYTWNPNDPCYDWKRPCFGELTFKSRGQLGCRYMYVHNMHNHNIEWIPYRKGPDLHTDTTNPNKEFNIGEHMFNGVCRCNGSYIIHHNPIPSSLVYFPIVVWMLFSSTLLKFNLFLLFDLLKVVGKK